MKYDDVPRSRVQDLSRRELFFSQDFSAEEFRKRRATVARKIGKGSHALLCSAPPVAYGDGMQDALFYYMCGLETKHTYLLISGADKKTTLFVPARKETGESPEDALGHEDAALIRKRLLIDAVKPVSEMTKHLKRVSTVYTPHAPVEGGGATRWAAKGCERNRMEHEWDQSEPQDVRFQRLLKERFPDLTIEDLCPIIDEMRTIKSPAEIEVLRQAGQLSATVMIESMKATRPGATETQLQAIAEYIFRHHGHCGKGYGIIAASGTNTWQGHYGRNNETLNSGELVLMDCGPDLRHYTSDIARVWPVSGTYDPWQRRVYGFITEYHKVLLSLIKPGCTAREIYDEAAKIMKHKIKSRTFPYPNVTRLLQQMIKRDVGYLNHAVGLSVHDAVGPWKDRPLQPGFVVVVDPMVWCEPQHHYIRVEDTIVVTRDGCERLTGAAPIEPDAIEALMKEESSFRV
jgi:Xaa-Pro aminopeptidase